MISLVPVDVAGQVTRWILAFHRTSESRWVRAIPGAYKHVSAFGYVRALDVWVFFDWRYSTLDILLARGAEATRFMNYYTCDADLLGMTPRKVGRGLRLGLWCVPAIKQLVGVSGSALRCDALWRDCIRQGAEILHEDAGPTSDSGRSVAAAAGAAGAE